MSEKSLKAGIIGIGNMGYAHLNCISSGKINGLELAAVCDIDVQRLDLAKAASPGVKLFSDWRKLIESNAVEAVIIATPHPLHALMAKAALQKNKHVMLEKPIDCSLKAANELVEAAKQSSSVFAVMLNQRTNSHFVRARRMAQSGELGELKAVRWIVSNWYRTQRYYQSSEWRATWNGEGGGVLMNQAPHNLDILQWIFGMPVAVSASIGMGRYHDIEVDDDAVLTMEFENGARGVFATSTGEYPGTNRLEIAGSKGKIVIEEGKFKLWRLKEDERKVCFSAEIGSPSIELECDEYDTYIEPGHAGILQNFTNAVLFGEQLISPGEDAINELQIAAGAYLSDADGGKRRSLPVPPQEHEKFLQAQRKREKTAFHSAKNESLNGGYDDRWKVRF